MKFELYWCSMKTKCFTNSVFEVTPPAKMDKFRPIDVDDKFWRIDSDLRTVVDFWIVDFSTSSWRMLETSSRKKTVEFSCSDTLLTLFVDTNRMLKNITDTFSFTCCRKNSHCPWTVGEFSLKVSKITLVKHLRLHVCFCF